jgi:ATP-dependent DNA ligase
MLAKLLRQCGDGIRLSDHLDGANGATVFVHACRMGLEGIVAKRRDRPYRSGRSPDWVKVKNPDAPQPDAYGSTDDNRRAAGYVLTGY